MDDPVVANVLKMIAETQRDQHASNTKILEKISDAVGEIQIDLAVMLRRLDELETWRRTIVDPFLANARDLTSQAKGAGKLVKWLYAIGAAVGIGTIYKVAMAVLATAPK